MIQYKKNLTNRRQVKTDKTEQTKHREDDQSLRAESLITVIIALAIEIRDTRQIIQDTQQCVFQII